MLDTVGQELVSQTMGPQKPVQRSTPLKPKGEHTRHTHTKTNQEPAHTMVHTMVLVHTSTHL